MVNKIGNALFVVIGIPFWIMISGVIIHPFVESIPLSLLIGAAGMMFIYHDSKKEVK